MLFSGLGENGMTLGSWRFGHTKPRGHGQGTANEVAMVQDEQNKLSLG